MDDREPEDLIEDALALLERVPDEMLMVALLGHPIIDRIVSAKQKNSMSAKRGMSGGWEVETKIYCGEDMGAALATLSTIASSLDAAYPPTTKK